MNLIPANHRTRPDIWLKYCTCVYIHVCARAHAHTHTHIHTLPDSEDGRAFLNSLLSVLAKFEYEPTQKMRPN